MSAAPPAEPSPYRGLASFGDSERDARLFFGRERETELVTANLMASRLTVLYGSSGVGKSSLLRAGVARRLRADEAPGAGRHIVAVCSTWSGDPLTAVADVVAAEVSRALSEEIQSIPGRPLADQLEEWCGLLDGEIYVVLDQLEEYVLYHGRDRGGPLAEALAEVVARPNLRVGVLLGIRDDALAQLDAFKVRVPALYANLLRVDHLSRDAGREAIVGPLAELAHDDATAMQAEPELVEAVLDQVAAGRITAAEGRGLLPEGSVNGRIEGPYLQLVMERLWEVEAARGCDLMRAATLNDLGGAARIVEEHLERALASLDPPARDVAASVFGVLVTPSGTKIAHSSGDLARYAGVGEAEVRPVLDHLAHERVLRPVADERGGAQRYEIFHDVLADPVLAWSVRHSGERELQRARTDARRRQRRLVAVASVALAGLAVMSALTVWAFVERDNAQEQTAAATAAKAVAIKEAAAARQAEQQAAQQAAAAESAQDEAESQASAAAAAQTEAEQQSAAAASAQQDATNQAAAAAEERDRADQQAEAADKARSQAEIEAAKALEARRASERDAARARSAKENAERQALAARANEQVARALSLLGTDPEGSLAASLQALALAPTAPVEGPLRSGLLASRVRDILPGGGGDVVAALPNAVAATPPARAASRLAAAGGGVVTVTDSGEIRVFDRTRGVLLRRIEHAGRVTTAAISRDGRLLAVAGPAGVVTLYVVSTGIALGSVQHVGAVTAIAFSPDGQLVASAGVNETAKVWSVDRSALVHRLEHPRSVRRVVFSADGSMLLTISNDSIARLFDLSTGELAQSFDHGAILTDAALAPDGKVLVTAGQDATPRLWDVGTGRLIANLRGHSGTVLTAAFSPAGDRVVTAGTDGTGRIWNAGAGLVESVLVGHTNFVGFASFSPDGQQVLTTSRDGTARIWNATNGAAQAQLLGHQGRLGAAAFDRGATGVVTSSEDGTARTWDLKLDDPESRLVATEPSPVTAVAASADGRLVADAHADGSVRVRAVGGKTLATIRHQGAVTGVVFSNGGREILTSGVDGRAIVWAARNGARRRSYEHGAPVSSALFAADGDVVTAGRDGVMRRWDATTSRGRVIAREGEPILDLALSSDGSLLASAVGRVVRLRSGLNGKSLRLLVGHRDTVTSVTFSPDGRYVLTASEDHDAILWNAKTGKVVRVFAGHVAVVNEAAFSPDGRWIATAGPTRAGLWETSGSGLRDNRLYFVAGHEKAISAVAFAGPRWRLVTGGSDGAVRMYDCALCGATATLARIASAKLARLDRDARR